MFSQPTAPVAGSAPSRRSILDSAADVFMEVGFSGARVDEIARRAHANKAMIYYHFGSKRGLYKTVLLELFGDVFAEIERLKSSEAPPGEKLRALYTLIASHFSRKKALPPIMLREILAGGRSMDAEASRALFTIVSFVSETLREGTRTGAFRRINPLLLHLTMLGPLMLQFAGAAFREWHLPREMPGLAQPSDREMLAHLLGVLDRSILPQNAGSSAPRRRPRKTK